MTTEHKALVKANRAEDLGGETVVRRVANLLTTQDDDDAELDAEEAGVNLDVLENYDDEGREEPGR